MSAAAERTVKVVLITLGSKKGYPYWEWRTVECCPHQSGYLNERGVKVLYRSQNLYRPNASRGKGPNAKAEAKRIAANYLAKVLDVPADQIKVR